MGTGRWGLMLLVLVVDVCTLMLMLMAEEDSPTAAAVAVLPAAAAPTAALHLVLHVVFFMPEHMMAQAENSTICLVKANITLPLEREQERAREHFYFGCMRTANCCCVFIFHRHFLRVPSDSLSPSLAFRCQNKFCCVKSIILTFVCSKLEIIRILCLSVEDDHHLCSLSI